MTLDQAKFEYGSKKNFLLSHPALGPGQKIMSYQLSSRWQTVISKIGCSVQEFQLSINKMLDDQARAQIGDDLALRKINFTLRMPKQKRKDGIKIKGLVEDALQDALYHSEVVDSHYLLEWDDTKILSCLRVTFSEDRDCAPAKEHFSSDVRRIGPSPYMGWQTDRLDVELLYKSHGDFTAYEMACMAALSAVETWPKSKVSIVSVITHPKCVREYLGKKIQCGPIHIFVPTLNGALKHWKGSEHSQASDGDIEFWMGKRGFKIGGRYSHDLCPFDPGRESKSPNPVVVGEDGVSCFSCRSHGHESGGYASWDSLVGGRAHNSIILGAHNFVPWQHQRFVVKADYGDRLPDKIARVCYRSLCKLLHNPNDPRINSVTRDFNIVRLSSGTWGDPEFLNPKRADKCVFRVMPTCQQSQFNRAENKWEIIVDPVAVNDHESTNDLMGWAPLVPVRGSLIWNQYLPSTRKKGDRRIPAQIPRGPGETLPRYLAPKHKERIPYDKCVSILMKKFPGLFIEYLELLCVARGFAESGFGPTPRIMATGVSGAGKTKTVELAAEICGDNSTIIDGNTTVKLDQHIGTAASKNGFIIIDEFAKDIWGVKLRQRFNNILSFDRKFNYHMLYTGTVEVDYRSVTVVTNIAYDQDLYDNVQIGRRFIRVHLSHRIPDNQNWVKTSGGIESFRARNKNLCDSIISHYIDKHFSDIEEFEKEKLTFEAVAQRIGFSTCEKFHLAKFGHESSPPFRKKDLIRQMFFIVQGLGEAGSRFNRNNTKGWKKLNIDDWNSEAMTLWRELTSDPERPGAQSSIIDEHDLNEVLGAKHGTKIYFDRKAYGRTIAMRFTQQDPNDKRKRFINGEIPISYTEKEVMGEEK